ncbi:hypothetical protein [Nocardia sp. NPDC052566]|uniref:hypothetical protein n=1 Tax=Nocardia sp. NPDC052566 TaxID=3364330 RepID=UPI0037C5A1EF
MMGQVLRRGIGYRVVMGLAGAMVLFGPAAAATAEPVVELNAYCQDHGALGRLANGRAAYCTQVQRTDAFVWSYHRASLTRDPNTRGYTCDEDACRWPDGSNVPGAHRCGLLCGEPPTSGDVQSGFYDCFKTGADFEECETRTR